MSSDTGAAVEVGCWLLPHDALVDLLHQAWDGEDPDMLLVELYANSEDGDDAEEQCGWSDPGWLIGAAAAVVGVSAVVVGLWWARRAT